MVLLDVLGMIIPKSGTTYLPLIIEPYKMTTILFPSFYRKSVIEQKKKRWKSQCPSDCRLNIDGKSFFIQGNSTIH